MTSKVNLIGLITIMLWPVVPLFWIPVHGFPKVFKRIGFPSYIIAFAVWLPVAYLIYHERSFLLHYKVEFPLFISVAGIILVIAGSLLHIWTGKLLRVTGLIGVPEISPGAKSRFVTEGPFSVVRHPTYLAHTMMFLGIFFATGVTAVGLVTILDFLVVNAVVIPLEERELLMRFGEEYKCYMDTVAKFFPRLRFRKL